MTSHDVTSQQATIIFGLFKIIIVGRCYPSNSDTNHTEHGLFHVLWKSREIKKSRSSFSLCPCTEQHQCSVLSYQPYSVTCWTLKACTLQLELRRQTRKELTNQWSNSDFIMQSGYYVSTLLSKHEGWACHLSHWTCPFAYTTAFRQHATQSCQRCCRYSRRAAQLCTWTHAAHNQNVKNVWMPSIFLWNAVTNNYGHNAGTNYLITASWYLTFCISFVQQMSSSLCIVR
jgi:hypothetical protein